MRRSAMVRALGVTTRPSVHRISGLFGLDSRTSFSGVICSARAAVSMLLPARRTGSSRSYGRVRNCIRERNAAVNATPIAAVVVCL